MKNPKGFSNNISIEYRNGHLETDTIHDSPQLTYARRMLATGEEIVYRLRKPWTPLITARILKWLMLDKSHVMPVLKECIELRQKQLFGNRRLAQRQEVRPPKPAELPATLDPQAEDYAMQVSRLRYVRNRLIAALTPGHVTIGRFVYHTDMLGQVNALLRPWYNSQWDAMQKVLDERRERFLERLEAEKTEDEYGEG